MLDLPWEYALIKFSGKKFSGNIVPVLLDLVERGFVRFVHIVFIQKEKNGSTCTIKLSDLEPAVYKMFVPWANTVPAFLRMTIWTCRLVNFPRIQQQLSSSGRTCA